jgi:hypothetical protein
MTYHNTVIILLQQIKKGMAWEKKLWYSNSVQFSILH